MREIKFSFHVEIFLFLSPTAVFGGNPEFFSNFMMLGAKHCMKLDAEQCGVDNSCGNQYSCFDILLTEATC